jgi:hypothetical protein
MDEQGITGHGQQEQRDRGHEPGGWPYSSHRSVSSALRSHWFRDPTRNLSQLSHGLTGR